jgi:hypothetical protein
MNINTKYIDIYNPENASIIPMSLSIKKHRLCQTSKLQITYRISKIKT